MYPVIHFLNRMDRGFKKVLSVSDPYPYPHKLSGLNPVNGHPVPSPIYAYCIEPFGVWHRLPDCYGGIGQSAAILSGLGL